MHKFVSKSESESSFFPNERVQHLNIQQEALYLLNIKREAVFQVLNACLQRIPPFSKIPDRPFLHECREEIHRRKIRSKTLHTIGTLILKSLFLISYIKMMFLNPSN